ncbi:hypothetical protein Q4512_03595 [Oceanihabitans sp. 2_MG-2023]|uniref:hypothetical protein n=1 Tax=Oceanihabitans sp. 2_MG-2023 TaxID=3062661 RepID=UPI0026E1C88F|nr:hypothetical protein [Oceanihabitans sp. 2_MG-2023]MDO6595984.1 hypothetical protein [Oceanihabitans sp. 2_MG-2023]
MKYVSFIILLFAASALFAQDSTKTNTVIPPKIVTKLNFGEDLQVNDIRLKFVEVVQDSRCPKAVQCIWEGEVIILVDVYEHNKKVVQKKLVFNARSTFNNEIGNLFTSDVLNISGIKVMPYPVASNKILKEDYYVQLDVSN